MPAPKPNPKRDAVLREQIGLVSAADLIKQLGVSRQTLCKWVRKRQFPAPIFVSIGSPAKMAASLTSPTGWLANRPSAASDDRVATPRRECRRPGARLPPKARRTRREAAMPRQPAFALIDKNLCNYPLARDARASCRWRRRKDTHHWFTELPGEERIEYELPGDVDERLIRHPTAFDMTCCFCC